MTALDWLLAPGLLPWAGAHLAHPRLRSDIAERFGLSTPAVTPGALWVVSASVGEVRAASALIEALNQPVLWTVDTDTGVKLARELAQSWPEVTAMRRPVDHGFTLAPVWSQCRPCGVVFVEGAWWPKLAAQAKRDNVPVVRVSARPGAGTARWLALGGVGDLAVVQSEVGARWFGARCDVPVVVGGNLKASASVKRSPLVWCGDFAVAANTRPGDEARCLDSNYAGTWLLAPRHLVRLPEIEAMLRDRQLNYQLRTQITGPVPKTLDVVVLDTMGELDALYAGAQLAVIGGTFDLVVGGHSPLSAARAGVPVVCGPHTASQGDGFCSVNAFHTTEDRLGEAIQQAIGTLPAVPKQDAAIRTVRALRPYLGAPAPVRPPRPWAKPLTPAYRLAERLHRHSWTWRTPARLTVPVVSIGSANARSPGRTSTVRWMAEQLQLRGHRPGIATRGYRRTGSGLGASWRGHRSTELGDEGAMLAEQGWTVAAHPDRVQAAQALADQGVTVIILDDGLQRRHLHRDVDLVVVDGRFPHARGWLPAGDAREAPIPERADGVIYHHERPGGAVGALAVRRPGPWFHSGTQGTLPAGPVAAFAGIGHPGEFFGQLNRAARCWALRDHQPVSEALASALLTWANGAPLVCTAKDHARLPASLRDRVWYRDIELTLTDVPERWFPEPPPC
ncbi:MAG: tetraacyldisaccharide 4'-kinase [Rhodobacterales bacterium]|nr:tetraacyldisaccharide 4'-kinase [Rhodobacterales bacterium]